MLAGAANGLFGAGGGLLTVPMLIKCNMERKKAHATSVSVTVFLSAASLCVYLLNNSFSFVSALKFIPFGLVGAAVGALILKKVNPDVLKVIFALLLIVSGIRMIFK